MNQYLLLRNNKKSGPFSALELASMGLKPFDLIWLDGKSAAWRYPGEIDELKSFAPPVEEQPYDRFYIKKPKDQPSQPTRDSQQPATTHLNSCSGNQNTQVSRIFVAVPGGTSKKETSNCGSSEMSPLNSYEIENERNEHIHHDYLPSGEVKPIMDQMSQSSVEKKSMIEPLEKPDYSKSANTNLNIIYWSIAAMLFFVVATTFIYFNYQEQKTELKKLNQLVLNMQQNQLPEPNPLSKNVVATFPIVASSVMHDSMKTEMTLVPSTAKIPVKKTNAGKITVVDSPSVKHSEKNDTVNDDIPEKNTIEEQPSIRKEFNRKNIAQFVKLTSNKYKVGLLGGVSDLKLTLTNKSEVAFDKVEVQLEFLGPENKVIKTQMVNFENVASGSSITLDIPRSGRGVSVKYNIASIQKEDEVIALF